jgi:hypothetical protein
MSIDEFDRIIPVNPPIVNKKINPKVQFIAGVKLILFLDRVDSHLNTLIPVGIAIIIVIDV